MRLTGLFAAAAVLAVACGTTPQDASSPPPPAPSGPSDAGVVPTTPADAGEDASTDAGADGGNALFDGEILVRGLIEGTAFGAFVRPTSFPLALPTLGDGHCDLHPRDAGDDFIASFAADPNATYVSLGPTVKIASAAGTLVSAPLGSSAWYHGETTSFFSFGADVTFTTDGDANGLPATSLGPFHVPSQVTPTPDSVDGTITLDGGPVRIHYGGGTGAQSFHVHIPSVDHDVDCYPAPSSTEIELPQAVVDVLDHSFVPLVWAESRYVVSLAGKRVLVRVTSDNLD